MSTKEMDKGMKVIQLTKVASWVMILVCVVADIFGYYICRYGWDVMVCDEMQKGILAEQSFAFPMFIALYYIGTFFAYMILFNVIRLLKNLEKDKVFVKDNTSLMKNMTIACSAIFGICFVGMLIWPSLLFIGVIGLFMGLIVQCVRVVMDKAIDMRDELDLTV
ncbi:MAG: DUF2975 domain-containing protein [Clostridia bacterium]|nr:DUF2975 domain-containing protein [Clostridia bacterium]